MTREQATALFERVYRQLSGIPHNVYISLTYKHFGGIWNKATDTWCVEADGETFKSEEDWRQYKRMHAILETDEDLEEYADAARAEAEREMEGE